MRALRLLSALLVFALVLVACGSDDSGTATEMTQATQASQTLATMAAEDAASEERAFVPGDEADALGAGGLDAANVQPVNFGRDIIFTAEVVVGVDDVGAASAQATNAITELGGFVFGQQTTGGPNAASTITFKIPPENFQAALAALGTVGEVRTQNVSASDVTDRVVDLESRIRTAEASVARLNSFLETAGDIDTIAQLEAELLDRETNLEVLRGQLRTIRDAVSLATITVTLRQAESDPRLSVGLSGYLDQGDNGISCPGSPDLRVLEDESVTVCIELTNTGDTLLTDFTISDAVLGIETEDLTVVWGDPAVPLEPGQALIYSTNITLERTIRPQTRVTATPVNADGERIEARELTQTVGATFTARDPGGLPGFADGVERSWEVLRDLGGVVILLVGIAVPFLWVPLVAYGVWRWRKGRETAAHNHTDAAPPAEPIDAP